MVVQICIESHTGRLYVVALDDTQFHFATVLYLKHKIEALDGIPGIITIEIATVTQIFILYASTIKLTCNHIPCD